MRRNRRGTTLVELMVYAALFGLLGTGVAAAFTAGNRWYQTTKDVLQAEQDAHNLPVRLAKELRESSVGSVHFFPNYWDWSAPRGLTFISPRTVTAAETFQFNTMTGRARWYKYVCYYVATDPVNKQQLAVFRKEWQPSWLNPDGRAQKLSINYCTEWFRDNNALPRRKVASNIVPATSSYPHGGFDVYSGDPELGTSNYENASNPICISVCTDGYG